MDLEIHDLGGAQSRSWSNPPVFIDQNGPRGGPDPWFLPFGLQIGPEESGAEVAFVPFFVDRNRSGASAADPWRRLGVDPGALPYIGL